MPCSKSYYSRTVNPVVQAAAVGANDVLFDMVEIPNALPYPGDTVMLEGIELFDASDLCTDLRLIFFSRPLLINTDYGLAVGEATGDTIDLTTHGLIVLDSLFAEINRVHAASAMPGGLTEGTTYYVETQATANDVKVSATRAGSAIDITSVGVGGMRIWNLAALGTVNAAVSITDDQAVELVAGGYLVDVSAHLVDMTLSRYYSMNDLGILLQGHTATAAQPLPLGKETSLWVGGITAGFTPNAIDDLVLRLHFVSF